MSLLDKTSLVLTPNAIKEGKIYAAKPNNGNGDMTVVRATTATRVNSEGFIEEVPYNLVTNSEQVQNWSGLIDVTISQNEFVSPNNIQNADIVIPNTGNTTHWVSAAFSTTSGNTYTQTIFAKSAGYNFLQIIADSTGFSTMTDWFNINLINGTFGNGIMNNIISRSIIPVGNGWYKISLSKVSNSTSNNSRIILNPIITDIIA